MSTTSRSRRRAFSALAATGALALGAALVFASAGAANAASQSFALHGQINNTALQPAPGQDFGSQTVDVTVTPSSTAPSGPIEIKVSSSTFSIPNGPAAAVGVNAEELDVTIALNGTSYILRGSQNGQIVGTNPTPDPDDPDSYAGCGTADAPQTNYLFDKGWVVSSVAGDSSSTSTNACSQATSSSTAGTVAGNSGLGSVTRGAGGFTAGNPQCTGDGTPVAILAPNAAGTYPITLKAINVNSLGTTSTLCDPFDEAINTANSTSNTTAPARTFALNTASSFLTYTTPETLTVVSDVPTSPTASVTDTITNSPTQSASDTSSASATGTPPTDVDEAPALLLIPLVALVIFGAGYVISRRRSGRFGTHS